MPTSNLKKNKVERVDESTYKVEIKKERVENNKSTLEQLAEAVNYFIKRNSKEIRATENVVK